MLKDAEVRARRWVEEVFNDRRLAAADEIFSSAHVLHDPMTGGVPRGPEGMKRFAEIYHRGFSDVRLSIDDLFSGGDSVAGGEKVAVRWTGRGTHDGPLLGLAPTGRQVSASGTTVHRVVDGRLAETWFTWDNTQLMHSLSADFEELRASRARIVQAGDAERRRIERDLHDGVQQRLVSLVLRVKLERRKAAGGAGVQADRGEALLDHVERELGDVLVELRTLVSGILPPVLADRGLAAAVEELSARVPVAVDVEEMPAGRLPERVEVAAYFVVSEALANVAKHAGATRASIRVSRRDGHAVVEVADDGAGGANAADGSGLRGLADRVGALDGRLEIDSPPGHGTRITAEIPCGS